MRYFHPTCASKVLGKNTLRDVLQYGHTTLPGERIDYQLGYHYPRECRECGGLIPGDQGLVTYEREGD